MKATALAGVALADAVARDQLSVGIERDESPQIAEPAAIVLRRKVRLLLPDIRPNLIHLNPAARQLAHLLVH